MEYQFSYRKKVVWTPELSTSKGYFSNLQKPRYPKFPLGEVKNAGS